MFNRTVPCSAVHPSTSLLIPIRSGDIGLPFDSPHRDACSASGTGEFLLLKARFVHPAVSTTGCIYTCAFPFCAHERLHYGVTTHVMLAADLDFQPGARKNLPKTPGLLVLSQEEAILTNIASDCSCLQQTCRLGLTAPPAACVALGQGLFLIIDSTATAVVLGIRAAPSVRDSGASGAQEMPGMFSIECRLQPSLSSQPADASAGPERSSRSERCLSKGSHVTCASALSCAHVPAMQQFAMLVAVGTMSGPSVVIGISKADHTAIATAQSHGSHTLYVSFSDRFPSSSASNFDSKPFVSTFLFVHLLDASANSPVKISSTNFCSNKSTRIQKYLLYYCTAPVPV